MSYVLAVTFVVWNYMTFQYIITSGLQEVTPEMLAYHLAIWHDAHIMLVLWHGNVFIKSLADMNRI